MTTPPKIDPVLLQEYEAVMASEDPTAAALLLLVRAYRERTLFFRDSTPAIIRAGEYPPPGARRILDETLESIGMKRPTARVKDGNAD